MRLTHSDNGASRPVNVRRVSGILGERLIHIAVICLLGLIVYSNTFHVPFQWDEGVFIRDNPVVRDFSYFLHPSQAPAQYYGALVGRYIGYLTFAINYRIDGFNVTGYHIFNLAVHILSAVLVYLLVVLTFKTPYFSRKKQTDKRQATMGSHEEAGAVGSVAPDIGPQPLNKGSSASNLQPLTSSFPADRPASFIALFAALLFVSHPVQTEAVTYIFQRFASLAAMFYLLSIIFYIKGRLGTQERGRTAGGGQGVQEAGKPQASNLLPPASNLKTGTRRAWPVAYYVLSVLFAVLAMKTKENAFTLPVIIILYEFLFFNGTGKTRALFLLPISLTLLIIPVSFLLAEGISANPYDPYSVAFRHIPRWDYFMTQARVLITCIRLFFLPFNQDLDYDYPVFHSLFNPEVFLSAFFLFLLFGFAVYLLYRSRKTVKPRAAGGSDQQPAISDYREEAGSGKTTSGMQQGTGLETDRPDFNEAGWWSQEKERATEPAGFLPRSSNVEPLTPGLHPFTPYYRLISFGILWFFITLSVESTLQSIPQIIDEYRMYLPMAGMALAAVTGLVLLFLRLGGKRAGASLMLAAFIFLAAFSAIAYERNAVWRTRISLWSDTAAKSPGKTSGHINLGAAYDAAGEIDKAISQYEIAVRLNPYYKESYIDLCYAYAEKNMADAAIRYCTTATSLYPGNPRIHYELGRMYLQKGLLDDARSQVEIVLQLKPGLYSARELLYEIKKRSY